MCGILEFLEAGAAVEADPVERELLEIEASAAFVNSPVMRRLLRFLVEESRAGRGDTLKSYTVAVDGLGKPEDFDAQHDSYPRVQIARLRKLLKVHYAQQPAGDRLRLDIPPGGYAVTIAATGAASSGQPARARADVVPPPATSAERQSPHRQTLLALAACAVLALTFALRGGYLFPGSGIGDSPWAVNDFPVVAVAPVTALDKSRQQQVYAAVLQSKLQQALSRFDSLNATTVVDGATDYVVHAELHTVPDGTDVIVSVANPDGGTSIWSRSRVFPRTPDGQPFDVAEVAGELSSALGQSSGIVHSDQRGKGLEANTPYGCWLRFMQGWRDRQAVDGDVEDCVARWKTYAPSNALAQALASWLDVERGRNKVGTMRGRERLAQAKTEAVNAVELDPNSATAQYALMHVSLYTDDGIAFAHAADKVINVNPNNPDLVALVGLHRIWRGDLSGVPILRRALKSHYYPPKWYYAGFFFAAVLKNDEPAAAAALLQFEDSRSSPMRAAAQTMIAANRGRLAAAHGYWRQAVALEPGLRDDPALVFRQWHLSPSVQERSLEWLAPAIGPYSKI